jgi:hypothetical protein
MYAQAAVKRDKAALQAAHIEALSQLAATADALLRLTPAAAAEAAALLGQQQQLGSAAADALKQQQEQQELLQEPHLVLLNLVKNPCDTKQLPQYLPALLVRRLEALPLSSGAANNGSSSSSAAGPFFLCLGADNQPLAVAAQHVVGVTREAAALASLLESSPEQLARLHSHLDTALANKRAWTLLRRMPSCQVTVGSTRTSPLALQLNVPLESFGMLQLPEPAAARIAAAQAAVGASKKVLRQQQQEATAAADSGSNGSGGGAGAGSSSDAAAAAAAAALTAAGSSSADTAAVLAMLSKLKGRDRVSAAKRLVKRARKLLAEAQEQEEVNTWNSFMVRCGWAGRAWYRACAVARGQGCVALRCLLACLLPGSPPTQPSTPPPTTITLITQDVLSILTELGAMEGGTLRLLPLGLVARGINCNNELWMAAAMSHPDVMGLTPPQLAAFVGALQCTDLLKRPMSIWSSFQVCGCVVWNAVCAVCCVLLCVMCVVCAACGPDPPTDARSWPPLPVILAHPRHTLSRHRPPCAPRCLTRSCRWWRRWSQRARPSLRRRPRLARRAGTSTSRSTCGWQVCVGRWVCGCAWIWVGGPWQGGAALSPRSGLPRHA